MMGSADLCCRITAGTWLGLLTGTPTTTMGIRILAPPKPVSEPRKPMSTDIKLRDTMFNITRIRDG